MSKQEIINQLDQLKSEMSHEHDKEYIQETIETLQNDCRRSSVVLGWGLLMHFLYHKMDERGLDICEQVAKDKNWRPGNLNHPYDLNKISDSNTLVLAREIGVLSKQMENQLTQQSQLRNNCAHVGEYTPSEHTVLAFFSDILQGVKIIQEREFETTKTNYTAKILNLEKEEIKNLPREGTKALNVVDRIADRLKYVQDQKGVKKYSNYYRYLLHLSKSTDPQILDEITDAFFVLLANEPRHVSPRKPLNKLGGKISNSVRFTENLKENPERVEAIIQAFSDSMSYREAESRARWILNIKGNLSDEQIRRVAKNAAQNRQIYEADKCEKILTPFLRSKKDVIPQGIWEDLNKTPLFSS